MKHLQFLQDIKVPAAKVYRLMLGLDDIKSYQDWTSAFNPDPDGAPGSYEGSWDKGSKILFVGLDQDGKRGGMVSKILENKPAEFVSVSHYGMVDGDQEITSGPLVEMWAGAMENYTFKERNGVTTVTVDLDTADAFAEMFSEMWPKALNRLKEICEG
ncbi:MAG: SRPBCC domain-containing protein [Imperialibacter sp.]|uniref:SRPBCC family protein n=1 Tax=Imperialibacter sp. TaxID=2038411 RepID=UPI0032EB1B41